MTKINNKLICTLIILTCFFVPANKIFGVQSSFFPNREHIPIHFPNQKQLDVAISNTEKQRNLGLGFVYKMSDKNGMLFLFKKSDWYTFWMKNMFIPIDIVFMNENKIVTDIYKNVLPSSFPRIYSPSKKVKYVLEINSGNSTKLGIKVGQKINFSK